MILFIRFLLCETQLINIGTSDQKINVLIIKKFGIIIMIFDTFKNIFMYIFMGYKNKSKNEKP
jgi:hypothetical protein